MGKSERGEIRINIPWFAVAFIVFSLINTALELSFGESWVSFMKEVLKPPILFLLAWSFAGIGFKVKIRDIASIGPGAFAGGLAVAIFAAITSLLLVKYVWLGTV